MQIRELLTERILNLFDANKKYQYADEVWNILQQSYKKIGGFSTASSPAELIGKSGLWKIMSRNGKVTAVKIYKDKFGRKGIGVGSDGSVQGKIDARSLIRDDIKFKRSWSEVSGSLEHIMEKYGAKPIPSKFAEFLTNKSILEYLSDEYHYVRLIKGMPFQKVIYGTINLSDTDKNNLKQLGIDVHDYSEIK